MPPVVIGVAHLEVILHPDDLLLLYQARRRHSVLEVPAHDAGVPDVERRRIGGMLRHVAEGRD